jgi:predicted PurR-regulated permease PerM
MKHENNETFNFGFLNKIMYIGAIIGIYYVLKNIGIMDKIIQALVSLTPVYIGIVVCWVSMPLANRLKKLGFSKNISAIISLIIIFGILALLFSIVIPMFVSQLASFIKELPNIYTSVIDKINLLLKEKFNIENGLQISSSIKDLNIVQNYLGNIVDYSINTVQSAIGIIVTIGTTIVVSFFMVKDMDNFKNAIMSLFSKNSKDINRYKMINEIDQTLMSYIKGIVIDSFIVGMMTMVVCIVLKLDYAVVFGMLIMVLNLIPYIGAILSYTLASLYALTVGGPVLALITFVSLLIVQIIDANILQPNIIAKSVNLHPVVVLGGLIVFQLFFGVFGMIIAVPVLAVLKIILKYKLNLSFDEITHSDNAENKKVKEKEM